MILARKTSAAGKLRERAIPESVARSMSSIVNCFFGRPVRIGVSFPGDTRNRTLRLCQELLGQHTSSTAAHIARCQLLRAQGRFAEAIPEYEAALASNRNLVYALFGLGQCKLRTGTIEETIPLIERAIRLSPRDPDLGAWCHEIGIAHLLQGQTEQAIAWLERARDASPAHSHFRADLAAAYALNGESERAAGELAEARELSTDDRFSSIARLKAVRHFGVSKIRALYEATYFEGLRKAGMQEE
jgi:adenylate cyclase